jgi:hypothetical protein
MQDVPKKTEFNSECLCFDEFPERRLELAAKLQIGESCLCFKFRIQVKIEVLVKVT